LSRSRTARRRARERALQTCDRPDRATVARAGTIAVRLAAGAEGVVLHQRLESRPPDPGPDVVAGRRYLLKEVFE
jgi:hypothetical protein